MTILIILVTLAIMLIAGLPLVIVRDYVPDYDEINNKLIARKVEIGIFRLGRFTKIRPYQSKY